MLQGLKENLISDEAFALFEEHAAKLLSEPPTRPDNSKIEKSILAAEKEHANLINAIKRGIYTDSIQAELVDVEKRIASLRLELKPEPLPALSLKQALPKARKRFKEAVRHLEDILSLQVGAAREQLKQLIKGKIQIQRQGDSLEALLEANTPEFYSKSMGKDFFCLVAGAGFEPTTFRL